MKLNYAESEIRVTTETEYAGHNLVFIVGCPRSGTTWLQRLLSKHPSIHTGQESHIFNVYIGPQLKAWDKQRKPQNRGGIGPACYFTEDQFITLLKNYMNSLLRPMIQPLKSGELFLEKSPQHALFMPEILYLLPKSRFIHIIRDSRDVVASLLSASRSWGSNWARKHPLHAARYWVKHVTAARNAGDKLQPWQYHEVRYEDLYKDTQNSLRGCFNFLNLEYNDTLTLQAIEENRKDVAKENHGGSKIPLGGEVAQHSGSFVSEPEGFIRNAVVGSWQKDLSLFEKLIVWKVVRKTMLDFGYRWPLFFMQ